MSRHLQVIRDLRQRIQLDPFDITAYRASKQNSIESGIEAERRLELIDALKRCEYLLEIGESVHSARTSH